MAEAKMGAKVLFCGHEGYFVADIWKVGNVNVVVANGPTNGNNVIRKNVKEEVTHHVTDFPQPGYWGERRGFFVVPANQVKEITDKNRDKFFRKT